MPGDRPDFRLLAPTFRQYPNGIQRRTRSATFKSSDLTCGNHAFIKQFLLGQGLFPISVSSDACHKR